MINQDFSESIEEAAAVIGKTWPLYSFVTSNPLSGYEGMPFKEAIQLAKKNMGSTVLPAASMFCQAWKNGEIDQNLLHKMLSEAGMHQSPEFYLQEMESEKSFISKNSNHELDRIVSKWLSVFVDEGLAEWEMPGKSNGFFTAWRNLVIHDKQINVGSVDEIPATPNEVLSFVLGNYPQQKPVDIFRYHLAALPGWVAFIKYRLSENSTWQQKYPITLEDYLAVRLWIAKHIGAEIMVTEVDQKSSFFELRYIWLKAWERSFQNNLTTRLNENLQQIKDVNPTETLPLAQIVFCIDTRSELIRRHIEAKNNYETFGYAGFFGLAMDYEDPISGLVRKSCPPILNSNYIICETAQNNQEHNLERFKQKVGYVKFADFLSQRLKNMLPSAFGYVEGAGLFYGFSLIYRTLFPNYSSMLKVNTTNYEKTCQPELHPIKSTLPEISVDEKVNILKSAFELLGWKTFSRLVVFAGHGSHSSNNPFGSSLDCGACAASPGRHNARMLAKLANLPEVRMALKEKFEIDIPKDTFFIGAEHNTATDEIVLFDAEIPQSHILIINQLKSDLFNIQQSAISERQGMKKNGLKTALRKVGNWAETRPEWGLAKNAAFVVAPRKITKDLDLESRCFLHSYDWEMDEEGLALEAIMQGPMVVTQWINNHYYFSTVDNERFGGGSKITHNVTGKFGVFQGNGGDLKIGLPLQSVNSSDKLNFHQPLRLSVIIQAPLSRVEKILHRNHQLKSLLDNEWIYLLIIDPFEANRISRYQGGTWVLVGDEKINFNVAI